MGFILISPPHQLTHNFQSTEFPVLRECVGTLLNQAFVYVCQVPPFSFFNSVKGHLFCQQRRDIGALLLFLACVTGDISCQDAGITTAHYDIGVVVRPQSYEAYVSKICSCTWTFCAQFHKCIDGNSQDGN